MGLHWAYTAAKIRKIPLPRFQGILASLLTTLLTLVSSTLAKLQATSCLESTTHWLTSWPDLHHIPRYTNQPHHNPLKSRACQFLKPLHMWWPHSTSLKRENPTPQYYLLTFIGPHTTLLITAPLKHIMWRLHLVCVSSRVVIVTVYNIHSQNCNLGRLHTIPKVIIAIKSLR